MYKNQLPPDMPWWVFWILLVMIGGVGGSVGYLQANKDKLQRRFFWIEALTGAFVSWAVGVFLCGRGINMSFIFPVTGLCAIFSKEALSILKHKVFKYLEYRGGNIDD